MVANWRALGACAPQAECGAVVKADAYGCGLAAVAPALWRAGCRTFFVAHLSEGIAARKILPEAALYVLNGLPPGHAEAFRAHRLRPVLGDAQELAEWAEATQGAGPAALHVDTGMNRLGLSVAEALALAGDPVIARAGIDLVISHLVSAELPDDPLNARQAADFARVRAAFPQMRASLANSSGTCLANDARHDLLRPGYALFGGNPDPGQPNPMRPVVRLEATILQVRDVEAGATCGYNARWQAPGPAPAGHALARLRRRLSPLRQQQRPRAGRRRALPDRRPDLDGPHHPRRHRRNPGPARRHRHADRRQPRHRHGGASRRHHRLRDPDEPGFPLCSRLCRVTDLSHPFPSS
ncbi:alanine racemase [Methylorubrum extorquens]|nr:alanine racemase [Methylorubrum extorquens]